ncbi:MAG: hypothetical protein EOS54_31755 [Mesorhizobium sp.]|uniref:hypothetical protein n=1 Tax=Mesorhizobium sp. TaxID=1871066 RepID=UPI000FE869BE|nr:hypothetical protein [Mesorhizobium sp.]RWC32852.1 MAG: hypothetical protein EOS54_31755 [Mesorhizobium sp.]
MRKPLAISQRQITAICKGAKAAGCIAELVIGGVIVRLVPDRRDELEEAQRQIEENDGLEPW